MKSRGLAATRALMAVNSRTGALPWHNRFGAPFYAAPTTVMIDDRQMLMMPAGTTLTAFGLHTRKPSTEGN